MEAVQRIPETRRPAKNPLKNQRHAADTEDGGLCEMSVSALQGAQSVQQLMAVLLQATVAQSVEQATQIALLNLQAQTGASPDGVGELIDLLA